MSWKMVHTESEMNSSGAVSGMKLNVGVFYISRSIFRILRKGEAGPKFFVQIIHFWPVSSSRVALGRAEKWLWSILVIVVPIALSLVFLMPRPRRLREAKWAMGTRMHCCPQNCPSLLDGGVLARGKAGFGALETYHNCDWRLWLVFLE